MQYFMSKLHYFTKMRNIYSTVLILLMLQDKVSSNFAQNVYEETLDRHQYTLYKDLRVSWIEAYVSCQADGAQLLYIDTKSEFQFLRQFLNNSGLANVQSQMFWTSGSDIYNENNFVWMSNGKSVANGMWAPGNPSNSGTGEHCVTVHGDPRYGFLLNDDTCSKQKYFICKSLINSQMTLQYKNARTNEELTSEKEMMNSETELLKVGLDSENYYAGDILAVLIVIAIAMVIVTAVVVKEEMKKMLKVWQRKTTSKCRLEESNDCYEQNI